MESDLANYLETVLTEYINYLEPHVLEANILDLDDFIKEVLEDAYTWCQSWSRHAPVEPEPTRENIEKELRHLLTDEDAENDNEG
uniref:Uncharacterized protein n=1 Tax=viral metagenome TaxID=1070528 RepID=A0A6M3MAA3_9ZZZZ